MSELLDNPSLFELLYITKITFDDDKSMYFKFEANKILKYEENDIKLIIKTLKERLKEYDNVILKNNIGEVINAYRQILKL
jgi:hypothetical protein